VSSKKGVILHLGKKHSNTNILEHFISHSKDYDIVISDIRMPGMNGYEFIRNVKENNPKVKVILMTAFEIDDKEFHNVLSDIKLDAFLQENQSLRVINLQR
jgi:CheY-like chemotaxis protein